MNTSTIKKLFVVWSLAAIAIFHAQTHAQNPPSIRIGIATAGVGTPPRVITGTMAVVQARRYIEDEFRHDGIKVEWFFFKGEGPAVNEAITNNQLDFASQGGLPSIVGRSVGLNTRVVFASSSRMNTYLAVNPGSNIRKVEDLRGKRIAFHKGTATQLAVNRILEMHGLTEKDVRIVNLDPPASIAALQAGDLDAVFGTLVLLRMQDEGKAKIVYSTRDAPTASSPSHIVVNQVFAQKYPVLTKRFVKALVKAALWSSAPENREDVFKLWAQAGSITAANYKYEYEDAPLAHRLTPLLDPFVVARDKQAVEDAYRYRLIRKKFDVDAWLDPSYLNAALHELKLENRWPKFDANGKPIGNS